MAKSMYYGASVCVATYASWLNGHSLLPWSILFPGGALYFSYLACSS